MWLKEKLKGTFVQRAYWKVRKLPPVRRIRKMYSRQHREKMLGRVYPGHYDVHAKGPVDENKVVFIEMRIATLGNSFQYLYDLLREGYSFDIHVHYLRETYVPRREYEKRCLAMLEDIATAKYVFVSEASMVTSCVNLRPETVMVQLWHGCGAFKKFGMSTADKVFGRSRTEQQRHPQYGNYSFVEVSSPQVAWAYAEAMSLEDKMDTIVADGISRTDIFFDQSAIARAYEHLYERFPAARGKKVILFAPTFRGRVASARTAEEFDVSKFAQAFEEEYVLVMKHHPIVRKIPPLPEQLERRFVYDATNTMSIEDLIMVSDICISDYSSLIYEYSLFERPMLFFAYDLEEYFDWRGFYYPYEELTPGPVCRTNEELIEWIRQVDTRFDRQRVADFKNKFMSACDGHATERILKRAMGEEVLRAHRRGSPQAEKKSPGPGDAARMPKELT